jgi:hypothetical protein
MLQHSNLKTKNAKPQFSSTNSWISGDVGSMIYETPGLGLKIERIV